MKSTVVNKGKHNFPHHLWMEDGEWEVEVRGEDADKVTVGVATVECEPNVVSCDYCGNADRITLTMGDCTMVWTRGGCDVGTFQEFLSKRVE